MARQLNPQGPSRRAGSVIYDKHTMDPSDEPCNMSVSNLSRTNTVISRTSRATISSRMSQWMTSPFRRLSSKESKSSSSTAFSNITNFEDIEAASVIWAHDGTSHRNRSKKVPMATLEALAQHHEVHRKASKEVEEELTRRKQELEEERRQVEEKRLALGKANDEIEDMREALGNVLGQLARLHHETEVSKQVVKDAEQRAADNRNAADFVYNMYVSLALEHQTVLSELETRRHAKSHARTIRTRSMPTLEEKEGAEELFEEAVVEPEKHESEFFEDTDTSGTDEGSECLLSATESITLSDNEAEYTEPQEMRAVASKTTVEVAC